MGIRSSVLFWLSRSRLPPPAKRTVEYAAYDAWRHESLASSWKAFEGTNLENKDIIDFGCGDGALSFYLATRYRPRSIRGVDLNPAAIERAKVACEGFRENLRCPVEFLQGSIDGLPVPDASADLLAAFDCLEHVMAPLEVLREWHRVLRPGGRCLIEWSPYRGPWGPHMESLIPVPWAHVAFGQKAMFRVAERIYDLPEFTPRHWDLDASGQKKPNKWKQWTSFREQGYINELSRRGFQRLVKQAGLTIVRNEARSFGGSAFRKLVGRTLMGTPVIGEYFVSYTVIELMKPK